MKTVKSHNKIQHTNKFFGLEFFDLFFLFFVFWVVFTFSKDLLVNLAVIAGTYVFLRVYKKGKPPHWTGSLVRFLVKPKKYQVKRERQKEVFE